jgi:hypothetical protein
MDDPAATGVSVEDEFGPMFRARAVLSIARGTGSVPRTFLRRSSVWEPWFYKRNSCPWDNRLKNVFRVLWSTGKFYPYEIVHDNLCFFEKFILKGRKVELPPLKRRSKTNALNRDRKRKAARLKASLAAERAQFERTTGATKPLLPRKEGRSVPVRDVVEVVHEEPPRGSTPPPPRGTFSCGVSLCSVQRRDEEGLLLVADQRKLVRSYGYIRPVLLPHVDGRRVRCVHRI